MATNVKRKKKAEVMSEDGSMTLTGHLKELRNRLIICAVVFVVGVIGFLAVSDKLIDLLTAMARNANYTFVFLAPQEKLMQYFRVSLIAAVVITVPVALYQIYAFAKPGLKRSESFFFKLVLLLGLMLFCIGILFAYKVTLPFMLKRRPDRTDAGTGYGPVEKRRLYARGHYVPRRHPRHGIRL